MKLTNKKMDKLINIFIVLSLRALFFSALISIISLREFNIKHIFLLLIPVLSVFYFLNYLEGIKNKLTPYHYLFLGIVFWGFIFFITIKN